MPISPKLQAQLDKASLEQAIKWQDTPEKFTFCIDELEISATEAFSDNWVNALEDKYVEILTENNLLSANGRD